MATDLQPFGIIVILGAMCCGTDNIWEKLLKKKKVIKQFHRIESILDPGTTSH